MNKNYLAQQIVVMSKTNDSYKLKINLVSMLILMKCKNNLQ